MTRTTWVLYFKFSMWDLFGMLTNRSRLFSFSQIFATEQEQNEE